MGRHAKLSPIAVTYVDDWIRVRQGWRKDFKVLAGHLGVCLGTVFDVAYRRRAYRRVPRG